MRNKIIAAIFVVAVLWGSLQLGNDVVVSADLYLAVLVGIIPALACVWIILRSHTADPRFLLRIFIAALSVRYFLAYVVYTRNLQAFLGGDAVTYDGFGYQLAQSWKGLV